MADERRPGQLVIDRNATLYEINPRELGTIDPIFFGFAPLEHLSSNFSDGQIEVCCMIRQYRLHHGHVQLTVQLGLATDEWQPAGCQNRETFYIRLERKEEWVC